MRRLKRFREITTNERLLLVRAFLMVGVARTCLWLLPADAARRFASLWARYLTARFSTTVGPLIWAVRIASQYVPKATCLTQAVALQALLTRSGYDSRIEIGVAKVDGGFEAHAWVACGDQVLIGGPDVTRYERLTTWESPLKKSAEAYI
jgi:hypothetical protein